MWYGITSIVLCMMMFYLSIITFIYKYEILIAVDRQTIDCLHVSL